MTAALRHRQSRSARLRGQLRPSDDRLAPIAGRGHSPTHHPPADHLSASPRAGRSPARHRRRASPRRHASLRLTALELRRSARSWQTEQRPPRRSLLRPVRTRPPARAAAAAAAVTASPARHRRRASPRRHASLRLTALELRRRRARGRRSSGRPGGRCSAPSESVRPRVLLPPPPPLHPVPVCRESCFVHVYGCGLICHT